MPSSLTLPSQRVHVPICTASSTSFVAPHELQLETCSLRTRTAIIRLAGRRGADCRRGELMSAKQPASRFFGPDCRNIRIDLRMMPPVRGPNLAVGLAGISKHGVGVWLKTAITPDAKLRVSLFRDAASPITTRYVSVGWCRPAKGRMYSVGLRFDRVLSADELADLLRPGPH